MGSQSQQAFIETDKQYVYDMRELDSVPDGVTSGKVMARRRLSGKSSSEGSAVTGEHLLIGLVDKARGSGSKFHTHPNEQFNFVMKGTLRCDIEGQTVLVPPGSVIHIPAGAIHSCVATGDEDVLFFVVKDTRHGIAGPPLDGKEDGPRILRDTSDVELPRSANAPKVMRYGYSFEELDKVPEGPNSATVTPKALVSGKSSSVGAALSGDKIHIGLIHKAAGSGSKLHTHPNEQFNFVLEGTLQVDIGGGTVLVPAGSAIHIPTGVVHSCCATKERDAIFIAVKDTRGGLAGPPVDGVWDGPRYL